MAGRIIRTDDIALWGTADRCETFHTTVGGATGADVDGVRAGWYRLAAGASNPADVHDVAEIYFIHEGAARIDLDGVEHRIGAGDTVVVPAGCHHQLHNDGEDDLVLVFLFSPPPTPRPSGGPPSPYGPLEG